LSVRRIPLLERPVIRSVSDALQHSGVGFARGDVRRFRKANRAEHFERSLDDQHGFAQGRLFAIGHLWLAKINLNGKVDDYGLVSCRVVTDAGAGFIVDAMQNLVEIEAMRFHGVGTNTAAEAAGNTALGAELTTQYSTSSTRPTGTLGEKTGDSKTYETSATITVSAGVAVTEHGIFSQAGVPGGVLLDRSVFAAVNLAAGEALQSTYQLTFPSGG
jgi:hypothetical protein